MMPEDARHEETRAWVTRASEDLRSARVLTDSGMLSSALFHCQQAAEKSIKAFLTWNQIAFPKTHDLEDLESLCSPLDPTLSPTLIPARPLTGYAWRFRDPGAPYQPDLLEAEETLIVASNVHNAVLARLPASARP